MITNSLRGADVKVFINGTQFNPIVSMRWSISTGRREIFGVDSIQAFELATGVSTIQGSVDFIRIRGSGGLEGAGIVAPESLLLLEKYFTLTVIDRLTDTVLLEVKQCYVTDQSIQVTTKSLISGSFSFKGIGHSNEIS